MHDIPSFHLKCQACYQKVSNYMVFYSHAQLTQINSIDI